MINGFGIVHGGIAFAGRFCFLHLPVTTKCLSVALDTSINFIKPVHVGDVLIAQKKRYITVNQPRLYHIEIINQHSHIVAHFKGLCYPHRISRCYKIIAYCGF